jgi:hypothetical protein
MNPPKTGRACTLVNPAAHEPPLPRAVAAEGQHDGDEVIAVGNRSEQTTDVAALDFRRVERRLEVDVGTHGPAS